MASANFTIELLDTDRELIRRLADSIEAASRLAANTEQPLVGPPEKSNGRPAALARPETLTEVETLIEDVRVLPHKYGFPIDYRRGWRECCNEILQRLGTLDQGTIASTTTKQFDSQIGKCEPVDGYDP
jgi:hypothetical protein